MDEKKRQAYIERAEARLKEWNARVDQMLAKASRAKAEGKIELYDRLEDLEARRDVARKRLAELKGGGGQAWAEVKAGMAQALAELEESVETLRRRFEEESRLDAATDS